MKQRGYISGIEVAILIAIVVILALTIYSSVVSAREWEAFRVAHNCKKIGEMDGSVSTGVGFIGGSNGGTVVTTHSTPGKIGWQCDDGVTYWKNK